MIVEPSVKQALVFIDGQNFFYGVKEAFGYQHPNFDAAKLASGFANSTGGI